MKHGSVMVFNLLTVSAFIALFSASFAAVVSDSNTVLLNGCCGVENRFQNGKCNPGSGVSSDLKEILSMQLFNGSRTLDVKWSSDLVLNSTEITEIEIPFLQNIKNQTSTPAEISPDGVLKYQNIYYQSAEYCIQGADSKSVKLKLVESICKNSTVAVAGRRVTCITKCCEYGQLLDLSGTKTGCVKSDHFNNWKPDLYTTSGMKLSAEEYKIAKLSISHYPPRNWCSTGGVLMLQEDFRHYPKSPFRILQSGQVVFKLRNQWPNLEENSFCIDGLLPAANDTEEVQDVVFHCLSPKNEENTELKEFTSMGFNYFEVLIVACFVSAGFLLITIAVYVLLWDNQNIHGWTLMCSFTSLCSNYLLIGTMHLYHLNSGGFQDQGQVTLCWSIGVALHFFYLSTFTWMTAVNFDLWSTFSDLQPTVGRTRKGLKKFMLYVLFALGVPLLIVSISVTLDYLYRNEILLEIILPDPEYALQQCFLGQNTSLLVYQYSPVGLLLIINIILFITTVRSLHNIQKSASFAVSRNSKRHKQSVRLFGKLFVIMGFSWGFEVISFFFSPNSVPWYWAVFDIINVCHGLLIFIIFVCKKSTVKSLSQKYSCFDKMFQGLKQCCSCTEAFETPIRISRSFTSTFSLSRFTKKDKNSQRKSSDSTEMSTISA